MLVVLLPALSLLLILASLQHEIFTAIVLLNIDYAKLVVYVSLPRKGRVKFGMKERRSRNSMSYYVLIFWGRRSLGIMGGNTHWQCVIITRGGARCIM